MAVERPLRCCLTVTISGVDVRVHCGDWALRDRPFYRVQNGSSLLALPGRYGDTASTHHAKWLVVGNKMLIGSCNFATASQNNAERGVLVCLTAEGRRQAEALFEEVFEVASKI